MVKNYYNTALKENNPVCYYLFKDFGIDKFCEYFVETGTHLGGSVQFALDFGFKKLFSCERMKDRYEYCKTKFKNNENVNLWLGNSETCFLEIMKHIDKKSCFWLDAHGEGGGVPTFFELDLIEKNNIKDHTIIIDDIPIYFAGKEKELEQKILSINKNYKIEYYKSINEFDDYILVACCL
jgi:hypothetical protein